MSNAQIASVAGGTALVAGGAGDLLRRFNQPTTGADSPADGFGGEFAEPANSSTGANISEEGLTQRGAAAEAETTAEGGELEMSEANAWGY